MVTSELGGGGGVAVVAESLALATVPASPLAVVVPVSWRLRLGFWSVVCALSTASIVNLDTDLIEGFDLDDYDLEIEDEEIGDPVVVNIVAPSASPRTVLRDENENEQPARQVRRGNNGERHT